MYYMQLLNEPKRYVTKARRSLLAVEIFLVEEPVGSYRIVSQNAIKTIFEKQILISPCPCIDTFEKQTIQINFGKFKT
ncbi:MAG: hypothetical protein BGO55_30870 [Sphingobacteriales bacterium 50-39]|nr:MAG: hypothetical protein BGO55_30870 [Sphingobacteriales bacterium 50-39]